MAGVPHPMHHAIKEQQGQLAEQQKELQEQRARLQWQQERIDALTRLVEKTARETSQPD